MYFKADEENRLNRDVFFAHLKNQVKKICSDLLNNQYVGKKQLHSENG
jgi:hypothetical protein